VDSQTWHDYCVSVPPPPPAALTAKQWHALSDDDYVMQLEKLEQWLGSLYMQTPELTAITDSMTRTVRANLYSPPGAKNIVALTGRNLAGKSTLAKRWARTLYREVTKDSRLDDRGRPVYCPREGWEADLCPVVFVDMDGGARIAVLDGLLLDFFGLPGGGPVRTLFPSALQAIQRHKVKVLIIDDAHFIKTAYKDARDVLDHIKKINTEIGELGATLVLVGADLAEHDVARDPQIAGRMRFRSFPEYECESSSDQQAWQRILHNLEGRLLPYLPAGKPGMLSMNLAGELWCRTQGYLGDLKDLVCQATVLATQDQDHRISRKHLDAAELSLRAELEEMENTPSGRRRRVKI